MDHQAKLTRAREIQKAIGQILLRDWDPIGVRDVPQAQNEYDSYVGGVYRLLASGASQQAVADYLADVEGGLMGSDHPSRRDLLPVAEKLCRVNVRFEHE
jgi:hypothetical protein